MEGSAFKEDRNFVFLQPNNDESLNSSNNYMNPSHDGFEIWAPVSNEFLVSTLMYNITFILTSDKQISTGRYQVKIGQSIF